MRQRTRRQPGTHARNRRRVDHHRIARRWRCDCAHRRPCSNALAQTHRLATRWRRSTLESGTAGFRRASASLASLRISIQFEDRVSVAASPKVAVRRHGALPRRLRSVDLAKVAHRRHAPAAFEKGPPRVVVRRKKLVFPCVFSVHKHEVISNIFQNVK